MEREHPAAGSTSAHAPAVGDVASTPATAGPRFAVVDIETSGLSLRRHRILQVAVIEVVGGRIVGEWATLVRLRWPWQRVGPQRVHGISRRSLRHAPELDDVLGELATRLDGAVFVAHNVSFDWAFVERAARRARVALRPTARLCTLNLSRRLDPERQQPHRLADLCERYGVSNDRPHDALHDARATASVLPLLLAAHGADGGAGLDALYEPAR
jgi:DNA polymerase III subunit epsilon